MTTVASPNVHALAVEGTFDDCQSMVKGMFNHACSRRTPASGETLSTGPGSPRRRSITSRQRSASAPLIGRSPSQPTGNFGDILAGWVAKRMGLPIERLMIGTNANDILARTLRSGAYEIKGVQPTASPSMDIQISSNFERLLFEAYGRDAGAIRRLMANLAQSKAFLVDTEPLASIRREFSAEAVDEAKVADEMAETFRSTWLCP